ncbi:TrkH family potassium uptake protein [Williamwhitmania taraxaci]|uniref:Trk-type K+ transport system, membrane component n=1 Tax=Williamwhitmania taraxaci TaxID=1640674 RepID=A0A1G6H217_9BACT|nr:potassium transporter TrkG [Williamwhitmania taraxaci]SDB88347.1 Trk-type K+ transport system, membrane component [Williamwhitmania taraxaci]
MNLWTIDFKYYSQIERLKRFFVTVLNHFSILAAASLLAILIYEFGFLHPNDRLDSVSTYYEFGLLYFVVIYCISLYKAFVSRRQDRFLRLTSLFKLGIVFFAFIGSVFFSVGDHHKLFLTIIGHHYFLNLTIVFLFLVEVGRASFNLFAKQANPAMLFIGSFTLLVSIGTGLLLLPNSTTHGISLVNALFTSTSAVCVTGLVVVDTATAFTPVGKMIILLLIQLGGLGVMTFTTFFGLFYRTESTFRSQMMIKEILNLDRVGGIFSALLKILLVTIIVEFIGALFIFQSISKVTAVGDFTDKVAFSVFHSISAFCNAGFSTLTDGLYTGFLRQNYTLQFWIMALIVLGGLGFPIIFSYFTLIRHFIGNKIRQFFGKQKRYMHMPRIINMNARIVVFTTMGLILIGAIMFFLLERNNTLVGEGILGKITGSFFGSITPRTAGFNTVDMSRLMPSTILITILLMWIGASPGSTGGGIKTTTFALSLLNVVNLATGRKLFVVGRREIPYDSVQRAFAVVFLSIIAIGLGSFFVIVFQPKLNYLSVLFECTSAFSTVGLSVGMTSQLTVASKIVIILLMLIGRVGLLSLVFSFLGNLHQGDSYRLPSESIYIN